MSDISRRLKKAEKALNMCRNKEKKIANIVWFGGGEVPEDFDNGYNIIHYVSLEEVLSRDKQL